MTPLISHSLIQVNDSKLMTIFLRDIIRHASHDGLTASHKANPGRRTEEAWTFVVIICSSFMYDGKSQRFLLALQDTPIWMLENYEEIRVELTLGYKGA
nr:hypothetical protein [Tanacetum cinerariifolium]